MKPIHVSAFLAWLISLGITTVVLIGCASPAMPEFTLSPSLLPQTATPMLQTIVSRPTQPAPPQNPLSDLPLKLGSTWVYSSVIYSGSKPQDILTSTYIYTDEIIDTRSVPPYFAAEVSRTVLLISGEPLFNAPEAEAWWYVISGTQIYRQPSNELDYSKIPASWLEYDFPLSQSGWYPDPDIRKITLPDSAFAGKRYAYPNEKVAVLAGEFKDCFLIATAYLGGATYAWFCPKIGITTEKFDHAGTPFGYQSVLMRYSAQTLP